MKRLGTLSGLWNKLNYHCLCESSGLSPKDALWVWPMKKSLLRGTLALCVVGTVACNRLSTPKEEPAAKAENAADLKAEDVPPGPSRATVEAPADVAAAPADAEKTASGLASKVLTPGQGTKKPGPEDVVEVHYTGWTTDGKMFDSSVTRGRPAMFPLNRVIKGWTEGVQLMVEGEKRRFWIPAALAYGDAPQGGAPAGLLVFDIELLKVQEAPKPIPAPADVAAPPKDAKATKSGLHYKVLEKGKGAKKPTATSQVRVHYTGWTTDGKMFDSSMVRGQPATFGLDQVIKGWTEGVQLMVEGEKARFWVPVDLAYNNQPGRPAGMLVFDVELLEIL